MRRVTLLGLGLALALALAACGTPADGDQVASLSGGNDATTTTTKLSTKHLARKRMQVETDRMMLRVCFGVRSCMLAGHPESGATEVYPLSSHLLAK